MTLASVYHLYYVIFTARGRQLVKDLWFRLKDARDLVDMLQYNLGLTPVKPKLDRFSYIEKAEYWALIWGTLVMAGTGFAMWLDNSFMNLFGKLGYDVARSIHYYEAILATLAIIVWHFYFVMFNPDSYPMNTAWSHGQALPPRDGGGAPPRARADPRGGGEGTGEGRDGRRGEGPKA